MQLLQTGNDIAADFDYVEIRPIREQLRFATRAAGRDRRALRQVPERNLRFESASLWRPRHPPGYGRFGFFGAAMFGVSTNQRITNVHTLADGPQFQANWKFRGEILQTVNGEVGPRFQQRDFEFPGEKPFWQRFGRVGQRRGLQLVAGRPDDFDFELQFGKRGAALVENEVRLGQREGAAARGDDHGFGDS